MTTITAKIIKEGPEYSSASLYLSDRSDVNITLQIVIRPLYPNGFVLRQAYLVIEPVDTATLAEICLGISQHQECGANVLMRDMLAAPSFQKAAGDIILEALQRIKAADSIPKV